VLHRPVELAAQSGHSGWADNVIGLMVERGEVLERRPSPAIGFA